MTAPLLRASWVAAPDAAVRRYGERVRRCTQAGTTQAYVLTPKTPVMRSITGRLEHMDIDVYDTIPTHVVLTEVDSLDAGLALAIRS